jgi:hypothetical protein
MPPSPPSSHPPITMISRRPTPSHPGSSNDVNNNNSNSGRGFGCDRAAAEYPPPPRAFPGHPFWSLAPRGSSLHWSYCEPSDRRRPTSPIITGWASSIPDPARPPADISSRARYPRRIACVVHHCCTLAYLNRSSRARDDFTARIAASSTARRTALSLARVSVWVGTRFPIPHSLPLARSLDS